MNSTTDRISVEQLDRKVRDRNESNAANRGHDQFCWMCGRGVNVDRAQFIHMATTNELIATADGTPDDGQGWFPIGPECARKVPAAFLAKF